MGQLIPALPRWARHPIGRVVVHDGLLAALAMALTLIGRYALEGKAIPPAVLPQAVAVYGGLCVGVLLMLRVHQNVWRFTSFADVLRLGQGIVVANLLVLPVLFIWTRLADFPRSAPLICMAISFVLLAAGRVGAQMLHQGQVPHLQMWPPRRHGPPALLVGTADGLSRTLMAMRGLRPSPVTPVGLISADPSLPGRHLHGVRVLGGADALAELSHFPTVVLIDADADLTAATAEAAARVGANVLRWQPGHNSVSPATAADLLTRPARPTDMARLQAHLSGRRLLITGGGGAIGGALAQLAAHLNLERLIVLDQSETALHDIWMNLRDTCPTDIVLADVRDAAEMARVMTQHRPDIVLHAAAIKHVPLAQDHPVLTAQTNVLGTHAVLQATADIGAQMVLISTDKAVDPVGVMGLSKRAAEQLVLAAAHGRVVRFGNVLGSSGSMVPVFERQIAAGGPITLTDPAATRFVMSLPEAAGLVLQAATLPAGGLYVLDMGAPVRIQDLAERLVRLKGLRPHSDIAFEIIGLRPGEKLHEQLFAANETPVATDIPAIQGVIHPDRAAPDAALTTLRHAIDAHDAAGVIAALGGFAASPRVVQRNIS